MLIRIWPDELERLPEYSTTMPTGVCPWKTWKARSWLRKDRRNPTGPWVVRQYGDSVVRHGQVVCPNLEFTVTLLQGPRKGNEKLRFKTRCTLADDVFGGPKDE